ncbi:uncharacterized protein A4U43_C03F19380 [Asparagus officinalis]|uniref:Uncharacterized protein n=1 Tax=Asparagus officinalis TaxID=4686 RepID=A0A5P1FBC9_ASPOF|nr:X-linked retinitis pigmentosa GTPase regulator-interacting protein 1-like [Asparagus officinalis]XP_020257507.1 X-linked retinitis pigmentosa GTPase regulator-interacting protein 1-like [Asparagus officinalis]ONK75676.1 uncharacterized protein A4U43_C03F19380 [Asparagus officinalis]
MKPVFDAVKGSLRRELTFDQLYNKFRTLKHRYYRTVQSGVGPTEFDRAFFDLSVRAWGEKKPREAEPKVENRDDGDQQVEEEEQEEGEEEEKENYDDYDPGDSFKYLTDQMTKYFKREGLSLAMLELGLKHMDRSKAAALEKKWREHFQEELKIEAEYCDLKRELLDALVAGQKGANS